MSRISFIICHLAFIPLLISCSLEENPRDQIEETTAYTSVSALFQNTVATLYNYIGGYKDGQGLQGTCRGIYDLQTFGSDEAMLPTRGADWYDGGIWQHMYRHSWGSGHEIPKNAWLYLYKVITLCNHSLEVLDVQIRGKSLKGHLILVSARPLRKRAYYHHLPSLDERCETGKPQGGV